jgi:hypothetical protein
MIPSRAGPPQKKGAPLWRATLKTVGRSRVYHIPPSLQPFKGGRNGEVQSRGFLHQQDERCCVVCRSPVDNSNLGGHDRKSALAGPLYCLRCVDSFPLLLKKGEMR